MIEEQSRTSQQLGKRKRRRNGNREVVLKLCTHSESTNRVLWCPTLGLTHRTMLSLYFFWDQIEGEQSVKSHLYLKRLKSIIWSRFDILILQSLAPTSSLDTSLLALIQNNNSLFLVLCHTLTQCLPPTLFRQYITTVNCIALHLLKDT